MMKTTAILVRKVFVRPWEDLVRMRAHTNRQTHTARTPYIHYHLGVRALGLSCSLCSSGLGDTRICRQTIKKANKALLSLHARAMLIEKNISDHFIYTSCRDHITIEEVKNPPASCAE